VEKEELIKAFEATLIGDKKTRGSAWRKFIQDAAVLRKNLLAEQSKAETPKKAGPKKKVKEEQKSE